MGFDTFWILKEFIYLFIRCNTYFRKRTGWWPAWFGPRFCHWSLDENFVQKCLFRCIRPMTKNQMQNIKCYCFDLGCCCNSLREETRLSGCLFFFSEIATKIKMKTKKFSIWFLVIGWCNETNNSYWNCFPFPWI